MIKKKKNSYIQSKRAGSARLDLRPKVIIFLGRKIVTLDVKFYRADLLLYFKLHVK